VEATAQIATEHQYTFLNKFRAVHLHNIFNGSPHTPASDQLPEVTTHSLIMGLKETPRGYGLFLRADADRYRKGSVFLTHLAQNQNQAEAVADALGITISHKLGEVVWQGYTPEYKQNQILSYLCGSDNKRYITREEQLVRNTWKNDQLANREIKNSRQEECLVAGTALEVNALQAYAARTAMRKSGQDTASKAPTEFDMQTYHDLLLDIFDEETQEDI